MWIFVGDRLDNRVHVRRTSAQHRVAVHVGRGGMLLANQRLDEGNALRRLSRQAGADHRGADVFLELAQVRLVVLRQGRGLGLLFALQPRNQLDLAGVALFVERTLDASQDGLESREATIGLTFAPADLPRGIVVPKPRPGLGANLSVLDCRAGERAVDVQDRLSVERGHSQRGRDAAADLYAGTTSWTSVVLIHLRDAVLARIVEAWREGVVFAQRVDAHHEVRARFGDCGFVRDRGPPVCLAVCERDSRSCARGVVSLRHCVADDEVGLAWRQPVGQHACRKELDRGVGVELGDSGIAGDGVGRP